MTSSDIAEKRPVTAPALSKNDEEKHGSVTELDDLTVLGYKPELQRNRSMFTLLFQSLAIAAVSAIVNAASFSYHVSRSICTLLTPDKIADTIWLWRAFN